jgi:GTP-binding protein
VEILKAEYLISSPEMAKCPAPDRPEFAFIGRSNVGKSSLINMLCARPQLAKISSTPGKTQLINHFVIKSNHPEHANWYLVDLPGYGFAEVSQRTRRRWEQMIEQYLRYRENLFMIFVLIDSRHGPQKIDLEFLDRLEKWAIPCTLVFTKSDKENQRLVSKNVKDFLEALKKRRQFLPLHIVTSSVKKTGRDKWLAAVSELLSE